MCHLHWTLHKSDGPDLWCLCVCAFILWTDLWMHTWAIWYLTLCWIILCLPFTPRLCHCHYEWNCEMRPWMHKTHPLECIASQRRERRVQQCTTGCTRRPSLSCASHHRQGCAWTMLMLMHTCPPLGTILMQNAHTWYLSVFLQS